MQERIILFDLDGTLTDSGPGIMKASQFALRAYGVERDWQELDFFSVYAERGYPGRD